MNSLKDFWRDCRCLVVAMAIMLCLVFLFVKSNREDTRTSRDAARSFTNETYPSSNSQGPTNRGELPDTGSSMHGIFTSFWVTFVALALPALIIVVEIYTLNRMIKEQKERKKSTDALNSFRAALGRQNYMEQIAYLITTAKNEVLFTTATMEASWHSREQFEVFRVVKSRFARDENRRPSEVCDEDESATGMKKPVAANSYRHRGIVAKRPETLPGVIELLCFTKVELRMHPLLAISRLRFLVQDNERSLLGVAEKASECDGSAPSAIMQSSEPTTLSFSLDSTMLALALRTKFEELWQSSSDPWEYVNEFISTVGPQEDSHAQRSVLNWLKVGSENRKTIHDKLLEKCDNYKRLKPITEDEL